MTPRKPTRDAENITVDDPFVHPDLQAPYQGAHVDIEPAQPAFVEEYVPPVYDEASAAPESPRDALDEAVLARARELYTAERDRQQAEADGDPTRGLRDEGGRMKGQPVDIYPWERLPGDVQQMWLVRAAQEHAADPYALPDTDPKE